MNGRPAVAALATALLLTAASAEAQTGPTAPTAAAPTSTAAPPAASPAPAAESHPLAIRTGAGFNAGSVNGVSLLRADVSLGVSLDCTRYLTLYSDLHFGTTRFGYHGSLDDGLAVNAQLWSYFDVSLSAGAAGHVLRSGPFSLDLYGEFETTIANTSPHLDSLRITTPQGTYDVGPYGRSNSDLRLTWYRLALGTTLRVRWGIAEPRMTIGFEYFHGSLDVGLNPDSRDTLTRLGYDSSTVEAPHEISFFRVLLMPGVDFHLGPRDRLGLSVIVAPARDATTYGGSTMFSHSF